MNSYLLNNDLINLGPSSSQEIFPSKMFKSTNIFNYPLSEREADSNNETPNEASRTLNGENMNKIFIQDSKLNSGSEFCNKEESLLIPNNSNQDYYDEKKQKMSKEEVESLIDNKRSELDIKIYDMVTKNQVEERKLEEAINNESDEEEKAKLVKMLEGEIRKNENNIALLKE